MKRHLAIRQFLASVQDGVQIFLDLLNHEAPLQGALEYYPELQSPLLREMTSISMTRAWLREFFLGNLMVVHLGYVIWLLHRFFSFTFGANLIMIN